MFENMIVSGLFYVKMLNYKNQWVPTCSDPNILSSTQNIQIQLIIFPLS